MTRPSIELTTFSLPGRTYNHYIKGTLTMSRKVLVVFRGIYFGFFAVKKCFSRPFFTSH